MRKILLATLTAGVMSAGVANAVTVSGGTITVTATVAAVCSASTGNITFPGYTPGGGGQFANASISVKCTKGTGFNVVLDKGLNGTIAQRLMANGANTLQYQLYTTDPQVNPTPVIFGDGTSSSAMVPGTGNGIGNPVAVTVYGQLLDTAPNVNAPPGTYTDKVIVSVTY
jgi:spore coat protein U-like protein